MTTAMALLSLKATQPASFPDTCCCDFLSCWNRRRRLRGFSFFNLARSKNALCGLRVYIGSRCILLPKPPLKSFAKSFNQLLHLASNSVSMSAVLTFDVANQVCNLDSQFPIVGISGIQCGRTDIETAVRQVVSFGSTQSWTQEVALLTGHRACCAHQNLQQGLRQ